MTSVRFIENPSEKQKTSKGNMKSTICHDFPSTVLQHSTFLFFMPYEYCSSQQMICFVKNNAGLKQNIYIGDLKRLNC